MADLPLETLRERLAEQLAEWGAQFEAVLEELALKRRELEALRRAASLRDERLEPLEERVRGQEKLVAALKAEADEASALRRKIRATDLEVERLGTELDAKRAELEQTAARAATLERHLDTLTKAAGGEESAELQAMRVELEARKTLIRELRADAGRARALDKRLSEERAVVARLEADVRQHVETIRVLEEAVAQWKRKCQQFEDDRGAADASYVEELEDVSDNEPVLERTIVIDMHQSLLEARRYAAKYSDKE